MIPRTKIKFIKEWEDIKIGTIGIKLTGNGLHYRIRVKNKTYENVPRFYIQEIK